MCGIIAWQLQKPDPRIVPAAALAEWLMDARGKHSWGYWTPEFGLNKGLGLMHQNVPAGIFTNTTMMIGHCRYATTGAVVEANSHPFQKGNILGVHNGIVSNHKELNEKYNRNFDVDSEHIFQHIAENKPMKEINAYGAVVWIDLTNPGKIYACKFNDGVLEASSIYDDNDLKREGDATGTFIASTFDCVAGAMHLSGMNFETLKLEKDIVNVIENGGIYSTKTKIGMEDITRYTHTGPTQPPFPIRAMGTTPPSSGTSNTVGTTSLVPNIPDSASRRYFKESKVYAKCGVCSELGQTRWFDDIKMPICYLCWIEWSSDSSQTQAVKSWRADYRKKVITHMMGNPSQIQLLDGIPN